MRTLTNGILRVQVGDKGAGLMSLYDRRAERELLWQGDPTWWGHRSPLLFPIVGSLTDGAFTYAGIWSPPGAPFVCLEPWFGRCNEMDASNDLVDRPGMMGLAAGQRWHAGYDIEAEPA